MPPARTDRTPGRRLRVAYVYRHFNANGSIEAMYVRQAERLAQDEDVTLFCSSAERAATTAPLRFVDVDPIVRGQDRLRYAAECAAKGLARARTFRWSATARLVYGTYERAVARRAQRAGAA